MQSSKLRTYQIANPSQQRGAILVITLVVLVAMTLASVGLFHSVDTSTLLTSNIGFKRDTSARASTALKGVQTQLRTANFRIISENYCVVPACASNAYNYSPQILEASTDGIPVVMTDKSNFDTKFKGTWTSVATESAIMSAAQIEIRYLIERLCDATGSPDFAHCVLPASAYATQSHDIKGVPGVLGGDAGSNTLPLFRVTIRVDGPRNSLSYKQAFYSIP
ncbi:MAG TPA: hypothetical protein VFW00_08480 [Rhodocyclaceae bacterium]|nr:hypothetical protein [Rhodocyclaceae bacterium]